MANRAVVLLTGALVVAVLAACTSDEPVPPATTTTIAANAAAPAAAPTGAPTPSQSTRPSPTATPPGQTRAINGLFTEPRETEPDVRRTLGPRPPSLFAPWNREDVVVYDVQTMTETNLGPGGHARFSPDGTRLAWAAGTPGRFAELWVLDLVTGDQQLIGPGRSLVWVDDETLAFHPAGVSNTEELVDVATGARRPANGITLNPVYRPVEASGWRLDRVERGEYPRWRSTYELAHSSGARLPLRFDALRAVLTPDGTLFVVTVPDDPSGPPAELGPHIEFGTANVFAVDPASGEATFIASAVASAPGWAFDASASHVAWMEGFCGSQEPGVPSTRVFDRRNGTLTEIDDGMWLVLTPDGTIGRGAFGPTSLIDLETLDYTFVLPDGALDAAWSPDYRYAALSYAGGHGGRCG